MRLVAVGTNRLPVVGTGNDVAGVAGNRSARSGSNTAAGGPLRGRSGPRCRHLGGPAGEQCQIRGFIAPILPER